MDYEILFMKSPEFDDTYEWQSPCGREFEVRLCDDGALMLAELKPTGWIANPCEGDALKLDDDGTLSEKLKKLIKEDQVSPSEFYQAVPESVRPYLVKSGAGHSVGTLYQKHFSEVKSLIREALEGDYWYEHYSEEKAQKVMQQQHRSGQQARETMAYWQSKLDMLNSTVSSQAEGFKGITDLIGNPGEEQVHALMAFWNEPSVQTWDELAGMTILGGASPWQIWRSFDPDAPLTVERDENFARKWDSYPDPEQFMEELKRYRQRSIDQAKAKIEEAQRELDAIEQPVKSVT